METSELSADKESKVIFDIYFNWSFNRTDLRKEL